MGNKELIIIPSRGSSRQQFKEQAERLIQQQTVKLPYEFIDYKPKGRDPDLVERLKEGFKMSEIVYIWEDDDYYPPDYIEKMRLTDADDFVGVDQTIYYRVTDRTWQHFHHERRASLFCTALRTSALKNMDWPRPTYVNMDFTIWNHAYKGERNKIRWVEFPTLSPVGIKHGVGLCGGMGHTSELQHKDPNGDYLRTITNNDPFYQEFYVES